MITKSYRYRIYPNKKQEKLIQKTFGCTRFVYNYFLNLRIEKYKNNNELFSNTKCCKELTDLKKELTWLKEPDKFALQNAIRDLDNAYQNFFKGLSNFPKFKSKKSNLKSYRTTWNHSTNGGNIKFLGKSIQLPKLGYVKTRDKRIPCGKIMNAIITQEPNNHYYCSITCCDVEIKKYPETNKNVGIDLGLVDFAILSDGIKIENPRFYEQSEQKLAKLQRELSRKTIGSNRYNKARIKAAKLQRHIVNQRKDFLQKLTTDIVKNYDIICIEDLNIKELKESDSKLRNKRICDASWFSFIKMLTYKSQWYGKTLSVIDRYYPSSQICHICGNRDEKKSVEVRSWICPNCHSELDRDINAAINILNEGLRILTL